MLKWLRISWLSWMGVWVMEVEVVTTAAAAAAAAAVVVVVVVNLR